MCLWLSLYVWCMYVFVHTSKQSHLADSLPANYLLIKSKVTEGSVECKDHNDAYIKMSLIIYICRFHLKINTVYSAGQKKKHNTKMVIFGLKILFYTCKFFFNYLKTVICELMLLELGDLLGSSLLRNFFSAMRFW